MAAFWKGGKLDLATTLLTPAVTAPTVAAKPALLPIELKPLLISVPASLLISTWAPIDILGFILGVLLGPSVNKKWLRL